MGNIEISIRDSNKNLVGITKSDNIFVIENDLVRNELNRWDYFGTTIIDGQEYEIRKRFQEEIRTEDSDIGMFATFGVTSYVKNIHLVYSFTDAIVVAKNDHLTYIFTIYVSTDKPFFEK